MQISSFLPNPVGSDKEGELFTIQNNNEASVSLSGWHIKDEAGRSFWFFGQLEPGQEASFSLKGSSLILNNDGETLFLYNPQGQLVDELSYIGKASEGQLIKKELVITEEIKEQYFDPYAFKSLEANILSSAPSSPIYLSIVFAVILSTLAVFLINKIPKTEEEILIEAYEADD